VERAEGDIGGIDCAGENGVDIILAGAGEKGRVPNRVHEFQSEIPSEHRGRVQSTGSRRRTAVEEGNALVHAERRRRCRYRFHGDANRACCCGPGSVPAREWKDRMPPGGHGPSPIATLDCRGTSLVPWWYMAGIGGTGEMLPTGREPGENCEA
jgi:hypothetical protein